MRRTFAASLLLTLSLAMTLSSAYAWRTSSSAHSSSRVGRDLLLVTYTPDCATPAGQSEANSSTISTTPPIPSDACAPSTIDKHDGVFHRIGRGKVTNIGDYQLALLGGSAVVTSVSPQGGKNNQLPAGTCDPANFGLQVAVPEVVLAPNKTAEYDVLISIRRDAPDSCIGRAVAFQVAIDAEDTSNLPATLTSNFLNK